MTSKLNINWLNKCRCGNRMHTVETVRGSHVRLFEDDAVKCNSCGRKGVIQTCDSIATVLWETDEERAEGAAMTKSTITRERLQEIAEDGFLKHGESKELARMALAAMDSEPVAVPDHLTYIREPTLENILSDTEENSPMSHAARILAREVKFWRSAPLYRHAQPAPVVPDEMLCDFYEVSNWPDLVRELVKHVEQLQDSAKRNVKPWEDTFPETLLPAYIDRIKQADEACRASMLQAGNSPVIPDGYVMVPKEPTEDMIAAAMNCDDVLFNSDESFCVQFGNIYEAMLAAAPQPQNAPQNIPEIIPGWIPVSERMPEESGRYWCYVEEQNSLGKSHYQWNCSWNGERWWVENESGGVVTHWMPLPAAPQEVE
ncbi:TPA: DUF551 domain-containing protein [Raoultella ornithinolytica]